MAHAASHSASASASAPDSAPDPALEFDLKCDACGYNLRGLSSRGRCPECGRPIAEALAAYRAAWSSPVWALRLIAGSAYAAGGLVTVLAGLVVGAAALWLRTVWTGFAVGFGGLALVIVLGGAVSWVVGALLITEKPIDARLPASADRIRRRSRYYAAAVLAALFAVVPALLLPVVALGVALIGGFLAYRWLIEQVRFIEWLAVSWNWRRVAFAARWSRWTAHGLLVSAALLLIAAGARQFAGDVLIRIPYFVPVATVLRTVSGVLSLVAAPAVLILTALTHSRLRRALTVVVSRTDLT